MFQSVFSIRQLNGQALKDKAAKKAQSQLAEISRHLLEGKLEMSINNIEDLKALMAQIQDGNTECLKLLQTWHSSFKTMVKGAEQYANADLRISRQINQNLLILIDEFRKIPKSHLHPVGEMSLVLRETPI